MKTLFSIKIGETILKPTQQFSNHGSMISANAKMDKEIENRLAKAYVGRLYKHV